MELRPANNFTGSQPVRANLPPSASHGKENILSRMNGIAERIFSNPGEKEFKHDLFALSTRHLYSKLASLTPNRKSYVITGLVLADGVGDYYHILNVAEKIKEKFPHLDITMVVPHKDPHLPEKVRKPFNNDIKVHFNEYTISNQNRPGIRALMKSERIIDVSMENDEPMAELCARQKKEKDKYTFIGEYGKARGMGLNDNDLGILIRDKPQSSTLLDLKNTELKNILFGSTSPSEENLKTYQNSHELFVGYLKNRSYYQYSLIYTAIALLNSSDKKTLDMVVPPVDLQFVDMQFLKDQGIGKITILKKENDKIFQEEQILDPNPNLKELRFISMFPLEQSDFYNLLANTNPLVGCTGDHSVSEVISFDRIPFYEVRSAKIDFQKQLIQLAGKVGGPNHYLQAYLQELLNLFDEEQFDPSVGSDSLPKIKKQKESHLTAKQGEIVKSSVKMADLIKKDEFTLECHQFNELLRDQYSFNQTLENLVERQIALDNYQELQTVEHEIETEYLEGKLTLPNAQEKLIENIQKIVEKKSI